MKRLALALSFVVLSALAASAQAIHGHPQKAAYASPLEWPFASTQVHWLDVPTGMMQHTHIECNVPLYAEVTAGQKLAVPCVLKLFHVNGKITTTWTEVGSLKYGGTITAQDPYPGGPITTSTFTVNDPTYPNIVGRPMGLVTVPFTWTIDTTKGSAGSVGPFGWSKHGWNPVRMVERTSFADGETIDGFLGIPIWSNIDVTAPVLVISGDSEMQLRAGAQPSGPWGEMLVEVKNSYIPIADMPLGTTMNPSITPYSYGAPINFQSGTFDRRLDPDFHNGIPGALITSPIMYDTNVVPTLGLHTYFFRWDHTVGAVASDGAKPFQEASVILVTKVNVTDGTAPPITCQDPLADNVGGPLPCTYPPPPPPPCGAGGTTDVSFLGFVFRLTVSPTCVPSVVKI